MKKNKILFLVSVVFLILLFSTFASAKIDQQVIDELNANGKVKVIVVLKDETIVAKNSKQMSAASKSNQNMRSSVISTIGKEKVSNEFSSRNGFSASIKESDLIALQNNPNVQDVILDMPVHAFLEDSTKIINATDVWILQPYGINLTGQGRTICIIDTGINYAHPDLGNCTISYLEVNGTQENNEIESVHPYQNETRYTWIINKPGFSKIAVHFVNISSEAGYDFITIYDSSNSIVASYSGFHEDLWSPSVDGENITIVLESDQLVSDYGFFIDKIINGTANMNYDWSNCSKVISGWDFVNSDPDPMDDNGHGTHVSGIVVANGGIKGVAPDAKIISMKTLDGGGNGYLSDSTKAMEWCINRSSDFNISVISMSLGSGTLFSSYCDDLDLMTTAAINSAVNNNISVVIATGNNGTTFFTNISFPACIANATRIGASDKADNFAGYANRGNFTILLAPGTNINSASMIGGYMLDSGTSMATPHVAGAIAILQQYWLSQNNTLPSGQKLFDVLNSSGVQIYDTESARNYSRISITGALNLLDEKNPQATIIKSINSSLILGRDSINISWNSNDSLWLNFTKLNISYPNNSLVFESNSTNGIIELTSDNLSVVGNYSINIYAADKNNNSILISDIVTLIYSSPIIQTYIPNTLNFSFRKNNTIVFNHTSSDPDNLSLFYFWFLNNNLSSQLQNFTFNSSNYDIGNYNLTLVVSNNYSDSDNVSVSWNVTLRNANIPVIFNSSKHIGDFSWVQGNSLEDAVDLSNYFIDVDNDTLTYSLLNAIDITMSLSGNTASFYSDGDYYGSQVVQISASDLESIATSNELTIIITKKKSSGGSSSRSSPYVPVLIVNNSNLTTNNLSNTEIIQTVVNTTTITTEPIKNKKNDIMLRISNDESLIFKDVEASELYENSIKKPTGVKVYKILEIKIIDYGDYSSNYSINFNVPNAWMSEMNLTSEMIRLYRFNSTWSELNTKVIDSDNEITIFDAQTPGFSYFVIGAKDVNSNTYLSEEIKGKNMNLATQQILVKAVAGVLSVIAILLVIVIIDKYAKKKAQRMNIEITEQIKRVKEEEKKFKEDKKASKDKIAKKEDKIENKDKM